MKADEGGDTIKEQSVDYAPPEQTTHLIEELYLAKVRQARAMPIEEKILAGQRLFESACRITLAGIRDQNPEATADQCLEILRKRLELQRQLEQSS